MSTSPPVSFCLVLASMSLQGRAVSAIYWSTYVWRRGTEPDELGRKLAKSLHGISVQWCLQGQEWRCLFEHALIVFFGGLYWLGNKENAQAFTKTTRAESEIEACCVDSACLSGFRISLRLPSAYEDRQAAVRAVMPYCASSLRSSSSCSVLSRPCARRSSP